jgi:hypothetical protein
MNSRNLSYPARLGGPTFTALLADGTAVTRGATGHLGQLVPAMHQVGKKRNSRLVGWRIVWKAKP